MEKFSTKTNYLHLENDLPNNFLAEKIVLSSLLVSNESIELVSTNLIVQTFYFENHQKIYGAIITVYRKKNAIDIISLTTYLQDEGLLKQIGGIKVLIELHQQIPNLVYLHDYIRLLQDKFLRRTLIKLGYETINSKKLVYLDQQKLILVNRAHV